MSEYSEVEHAEYTTRDENGLEHVTLRAIMPVFKGAILDEQITKE